MANDLVRIVDNTRHVLEAIDRAKVRGLEAIGATAERYAKEDCPVDTGRLRSSISHAVIDDSYAIIGTNVEYAPYQEMGTIKMNAANNGRGFLRPAATGHNDEYKEIMRSSLSNA